MRGLLLASVALLASSLAADAQSFSISAALSPRGWPAGTSIPTIANTDAVYPGCPTPPTSFGNVWNFSPSGSTQATYTTAGISLNPLVTPHQGDATHPWGSIQAVFKTVSGYTAPLLATVSGGQSIIQAGDEIVLATGSYGDLVIGGSGSAGNEVVNSPALTIAAGSSQTPLFTSINVAGTTGLVLNGLKVQNHLSANNPLINIVDGSISGFTATNIILNHMDVSSDTVATSNGWSQATWQADGSEGIGIAASDLTYSKITCASVVNSHVYVTQGHNIGSINIWASNTLTQNNEIDHFATDAIEHAGSNVAIRLNYVHDAVLTQPFDQYFMINNVQDQGNGHQSNVTIDHNKVIESIDAAQLLQAHMGFYISSKGDITNFTAYDNLFAGTGGGLEAGTTHNTLIANNSLMGGIIDVEQGHAGILGTGTGPVGSPPSNVRITNNIASQFALAGAGIINLQADHNIVTNTTGNPWVYQYVYSTEFIPANPGALTTVAAAAASLCGCSDTGVANLMDGFGAGNEFTAVPTSGSFPMSPQPNWTPLFGSQAATMGGAVLVPALTDYNGAAFTPPYSIGALATTSPANQTFAALHTYYMAPTTASPAGNDSNNGTSAATPWATPNHTGLVCGDVIIAAAGNYAAMGSFGTVSTCPSTSAGIDGAGGVQFATLLCGGTDLGSNGCNISSSSTAINITKNNWAVEGWTATTSAAARSFQCDATATGTTIVSYQAYINDVSYNSAQAYDTDDGGHNTNVPGNGCDYQAVVGMIAQNSNSDPICLAAIDAVGPAPLDANAGTHILFYGNFAIANINNPSCHASDGEGFMFDSWDVHGFTGQGVMLDNITYQSSWAGLQIFQQTFNSSSPQMYVLNNTFYADNVCPFADHQNTGEINLQTNGTFPWSITIQKNIALTNRNHAVFGTNPGCASTSTGFVYAAQLDDVAGMTLTVGGTGNENVFKGQATGCGSGHCDSTNSVNSYAIGGYLGTNIYTDPLFTNATDLLANQIGVPNCTGFQTTTACMGYNATTTTLTTPSVISDLVPTAGAASGKGYQLPATTCASNALYPTWLKGIVYLHWNGTTITENAGLVTKPCGL